MIELYEQIKKTTALLNPNTNITESINTNIEVEVNKVYSVGDLFSFYLKNGDIQCLMFMTKEPIEELLPCCHIYDVDGFYVHLLFDNDEFILDRNHQKLIALKSTLIRLYVMEVA